MNKNIMYALYVSHAFRHSWEVRNNQGRRMYLNFILTFKEWVVYYPDWWRKRRREWDEEDTT